MFRIILCAVFFLALGCGEGPSAEQYRELCKQVTFKLDDNSRINVECIGEDGSRKIIAIEEQDGL